MIEEVALELEFDNEVHMSPLARWRERPRVRQVLQRSSLSSAHQHLPRSIQRDLARKAFPEWAEPDLEVSDDFPLILSVDTRAARTVGCASVSASTSSHSVSCRCTWPRDMRVAVGERM